VSAEQLLGELEGEDRIVVGDLEAGLGTVLRLEPGDADLVLVVAQPTAKSLDVAARALRVTADKVPAIVVANRVAGEDDVALIRSILGDEHELMEVPDDPVIARADEEGTAPIDAAGESAGVQALVALADRVRSLAGGPAGPS